MAAIIPMTAQWGRLFDGDPELRVNAEELGMYRGGVQQNSVGEIGLVTVSFDVEERYRGLGIGTRLMMGALALAKINGLDYSSADLSSPASLRIRQKIFGEEMEFRDVSDNNTVLPMSVDQAIKILRYQNDNPSEDDDQGIIVQSDLEKLDIDGWEIPTEINKLSEVNA